MTRSALAVLIFLVAFGVFGASARSTAHWADENYYLTTSHYFLHLFVERDLANPEWRDNYDTHSQPMIARYIIGGWLWLKGYDLYAMPRTYDLTKSVSENERKGRLPDPALLADARFPMIVLASGAIALLYLVGDALVSRTAGLAAAALALASPLAREHLVRAMPDAALAFFVLLALLVCVASERLGYRRGAILLAITAGVAMGLAFGSKLTAVMSLAAGIAWIMAATIVVPARRRPGVLATGAEPKDGETRWGDRARFWVLGIGVAMLVFAVSNPHLYANPALHTVHLFAHRAQEDLGRQKEVPKLAVRDPRDRVVRVLRGSFVTGTLGGSVGLPVEALLAVVGVGYLSIAGWRRLRSFGQIGPEGLFLLTAATYFAGTSAGLSLDYARYYVATLLLVCLLAGVGVHALIDWGRSRIGVRSPQISSALRRGTVTPRPS